MNFLTNLQTSTVLCMQFVIISNIQNAYTLLNYVTSAIVSAPNA